MFSIPMGHFIGMLLFFDVGLSSILEVLRGHGSCFVLFCLGELFISTG